MNLVKKRCNKATGLGVDTGRLNLLLSKAAQAMVRAREASGKCRTDRGFAVFWVTGMNSVSVIQYGQTAVT